MLLLHKFYLHGQISDIDKDGTGVIDFSEFLEMMTAKMSERDSREEILKAFRLFDDDETGIFVIVIAHNFDSIDHTIHAQERYHSEILSAWRKNWERI